MQLRAGPVALELDGPVVRHVRRGPVDVLEQLYVAVRDEAWNTIPPRLLARRVRRRDSAFRAWIHTEHSHPSIVVRCSARIDGAPDGTLTIDIRAVALRSFTYARIGLNLIHSDAAYAGRSFFARGPEGEQAGAFPSGIVPQPIVDGVERPLIRAFNSLDVFLDGARVSFTFGGDEFETEDQRNWADASFKTFSTPLDRPIPLRLDAGAELRQTVTIRTIPAGARQPRSTRKTDHVTIKLHRRESPPTPTIGLAAASHGSPITAAEGEILRAMAPGHVRVDLDPGEPSWTDRLDRASRDASRLAAPLEVAVVARDTLSSTIVTGALRNIDASVARVVVLPPPDGPEADYAARSHHRNVAEPLAAIAPLVSGTDRSFAELNRTGSELASFSGAAFPLCTAVHVADDETIVSNLAVLPRLVKRARDLCGGTVHVGPIGLSTRRGPYPRGPAGVGGSPPRLDPRQLSLLGAAWTVACFGQLAAAGVESATFFETTGSYGVMEREAGSEHHSVFPSIPCGVFPIYHVLADLGEFRQGRLIGVDVSDPRAVAALAIASGDRERIIGANLTSRPLTLTLSGLAHSIRIRRLNEGTWQVASVDPQRFRLRWRHRMDGEGAVRLAPYETVFFDSRTSGRG